MMSVTKTVRFEAAHRIEDHDGKCQRLHGHSYRVDVEFAAREDLDLLGMVVDFGHISELLDRVVMTMYDHRFLNEVHELRNATVERLVEWIVRDILHSTRNDPHFSTVRLMSVVAWETRDSKATWRRDPSGRPGIRARE